MEINIIVKWLCRDIKQKETNRFEEFDIDTKYDIFKIAIC